MSSITSLFSNATSMAQKNIGCLFAYREYLSEFKNKATRWLSKADEDAPLGEALSITLPSPYVEGERVVARLSQEVYQAAMDDGEALIQLAINEVDTVTAKGDEIIDALEESIGNVALQEEFVSQCLESEEISASAMFDKMRSKLPNASTASIEQLTSFVSGSDPILTLQSFLSTVNLFTNSAKTSPSGNQYVSVVAASDYIGCSVWEVAWNTVTSTLENFFAGVFDNLLNLQETFEKLGQAILSLIKYLAAKFFAPLTTNFDVVGGKLGLLDLPIFQHYIGDSIGGSYSTNTSYYSDFATNVRGHGPLVWYGTNRCWSEVDYADRFDDLAAVVSSALYETVGGQTYVRPYDVVIPSNPFSLCIRVGVTTDSKIVLSCYPVIPTETLKTATDEEILRMINVSVQGAIDTVSQLVPFFPYVPGVDFDDNVTYLAASVVIPPTGSQTVTPINMVQYLPCFDPSEQRAASPSDSNYAGRLMLGFLAYVAQHGPGLSAFSKPNPGQTEQQAWENTVGHLGLYGYRLVVLPTTVPGYSIETTIGPDDLGLSIDVRDTFQPYSQYKLLPFSIHYQTLQQQANEILRYIIIAVVAAAAVFVTVKFVQFRRKRIALAEIRQGYVDNMSWNLPQNPSKEQMQAYLKARKVARKTARLNSILGIASNAAASKVLQNSSDNIVDQLLGISGKAASGDESNSPCSLLAIRKLLDGYEG